MEELGGGKGVMEEEDRVMSREMLQDAPHYLKEVHFIESRRD